MAVKPVSTGEQATTKRKPQVRSGPRTVFAIFKEGTDPAFVKQVDEALDKLTMNGRELVKSLTGGSVKPFLTLKIDVEPKDAGQPVADQAAA